MIFENEILTFRTSNVSEKRQWLNQIESAIRASHTAEVPKPEGKSLGNAIGTLHVLISKAKKTNSSRTTRTSQILVVAKVGSQVLKSKRALIANPSFNQSFIFTIYSLDEILKLSIHGYDKYSADGSFLLILEYLGHAEIQLDFLEYYGERETEMINLAIKDGDLFHQLDIKLLYRNI
jgi:hypothetical protein